MQIFPSIFLNYSLPKIIEVQDSEKWQIFDRFMLRGAVVPCSLPPTAGPLCIFQISLLQPLFWHFHWAKCPHLIFICFLQNVDPLFSNYDGRLMAKLICRLFALQRVPVIRFWLSNCFSLLECQNGMLT